MEGGDDMFAALALALWAAAQLVKALQIARFI